MTEPKPKGKEVVQTRTPQKKTKAGIFDNLRQLPHPIDEWIAHPAQPNPTQPSPTRPDPAQAERPSPLAPERNYYKRENQVDDAALREGLFPGTSQKLYNALLKRTRGAVRPTRTVRATKRELMTWSQIRSKNTIAVNLKILISIGWIKVEHDAGAHEGSVYEVFLYDELQRRPNPTQPNPTQPDLTHPVPTQKLGGDPTQKLGWVGLGNPTDDKALSEGGKTSFKTKDRSDDEAFTKLRSVAQEITGKEQSDWTELEEVLVAELKIAAGRTTVSNVPAFLAEHLRRRLWKKEKRQLEAEASSAASAATTVTKVDAKQCPDCFGAGMYYPEGFEKGVARCPHEKLMSEKAK